MRGAGIKLLTTKNSPAGAHLLDVTRTVSRTRYRPTGIDRIERAYIQHLAELETPLFGILRTKIGYVLLDKDGCRQLLAHCETPVWDSSDLISRWTRRSDSARAVAEAGLRKIAWDRAVPARLRQMLQRNLPTGTVYFNTGQTNVNDRQIRAVKACEGARIVPYLHDTIPLDWPETQTPASQLKFKRMFDRVDAHADLVLCNSEDTKAHILRHAQRLMPSNVHVITPGLPAMQIGTAPDGPWNAKPYFMVIGTIEPRKNIGFLLDLWEDLTGPNDPHLLICGRRGWMSEDVCARLDARPANVHEMTDLGDPELWALLKCSQALLFPSLAEGFGYPAMEAAHLGVPVVCTPLPTFKNMLGDYPIYAEVTERYVWRNKIRQLAQRRRDQSGEQLRQMAFQAPSWQAHFNTLFTLL